MGNSVFSIFYYLSEKLTAMFRTAAIILALLGFSFSNALAQGKKTLSTEDYGKWQGIGSMGISPNGDWVAYQITLAEGNDTMYVKNILTGLGYR